MEIQDPKHLKLPMRLRAEQNGKHLSLGSPYLLLPYHIGGAYPMSGLITALAWLLIVLTFTGSYRVAHYLAAPAENSAATKFYPTLIAATITAAFVVVFDFIILLTGLAAVILPGYLLMNPEKSPGLPTVSDRVAGWRGRLGEGGHAVYEVVTDRVSSTGDETEAQQPADADPAQDQ